MANEKLMYVGLKGKVVALSRATGEMRWSTALGNALFSGGFVHIVVDGDCVFASTQGEITCLDAAKGTIRWHNPLRGYGVGLASIATATSSSPSNLIAHVITEQQAATTATTNAAMVNG